MTEETPVKIEPTTAMTTTSATVDTPQTPTNELQAPNDIEPYYRPAHIQPGVRPSIEDLGLPEDWLTRPIRLTKLTPEIASSLLQDIAEGMPPTLAAQRHHTTASSLNRWLQWGQQALEKYEETGAKPTGQTALYANLCVAVKGIEGETVKAWLRLVATEPKQWQRFGWLLERRHSDHFSRSQTVNVQGSVGLHPDTPERS